MVFNTNNSSLHITYIVKFHVQYTLMVGKWNTMNFLLGNIFKKLINNTHIEGNKEIICMIGELMKL